MRGDSCGVLARALVLWMGILAVSCAETKHVILMIADGAGFNCWKAASMYQGRWDAGRGKSTQVYDGPGWVSYGCSTFPMTTSKEPTGKGVQDPELVYDPGKAWGSTGAYAWLCKTFTDSAAAATALSTGKKTYNNAINWSDRNGPISPTMSERAKAAGRSAGVVTTVQWSHATPAGLSNAHNVDRDNYEAIAQEILGGGVMDVVMGAGNPDFNNEGRPVAKRRDCKHVGGEAAWAAIEAARARPDGLYKGYRPVSTKAEFEALVSGPAPSRVLGTAQVGNTLRQARAGKETADPARDTPVNPDLPDLPLMVRGALNVLDANPKGFFLMVEGGAVDWANHSNHAGRMIQEQMDFVAAVEAVVQWVETKSSWKDTLLVLTADHETGLLWGPDSDAKAFDPIADRGKGVMPGLKYQSKGHSNSLVPVYAKGAGSERFASKVVGKDPVRGPYVDNVGVSEVLAEAMGGR